MAGEEAAGDFELAFDDFVVTGEFGVFVDEFLVGVEGFFVAVEGFVAAADEVLGFGGIVGEGPGFDGTEGGAEGEFVLSGLEGVFGDFELVFGPITAPGFFGAGKDVDPSDTRPVDERGWGLWSSEPQADGYEDKKQSDPLHLPSTLSGSGSEVNAATPAKRGFSRAVTEKESFSGSGRCQVPVRMKE